MKNKMTLDDYIAALAELREVHGGEIEVISHAIGGGIDALSEATPPEVAYERAKRPREAYRKFWWDWDKEQKDVPHWPVIRV